MCNAHSTIICKENASTVSPIFYREDLHEQTFQSESLANKFFQFQSRPIIGQTAFIVISGVPSEQS